MAEISNGTLALLVLAALAVVVTTTTLQLNGGVTGLATTDSGDVTLSIATNLAIEVDATNNSIQFGTCTPNGSTQIEDSNNSGNESSCNAGALASPQRIQVNNVGNLDASVNVTAECTPADFIPTGGSGASDFEIATYSDGGCTGSMIGTYTTLSTTAQLACGNLTRATGSFWMPARVTIPSDTLTTQNCGSGTETTNTITFDAEQA